MLPQHALLAACASMSGVLTKSMGRCDDATREESNSKLFNFRLSSTDAAPFVNCAKILYTLNYFQSKYD